MYRFCAKIVGILSESSRNSHSNSVGMGMEIPVLWQPCYEEESDQLVVLLILRVCPSLVRGSRLHDQDRQERLLVL